MSGFLCDSSEGGNRSRGEGAGVWAPFVYGHDTGVEDFQPVEEPGELMWPTGVVGDGAGFVVVLKCGVMYRICVDGVVECQVSARQRAVRR